MNMHAASKRLGDAAFCPLPEESFTLPARYYFDQGIYDSEVEEIFYKSWWFAGHRSQLPAAGSFLRTQINDQSVVIVRAADGMLKAFHNVCQHRGHELVKAESDTTRLFTCPYHAWTYNLDGSLRSARLTKSMPNFHACDFSLKAVRLEELCGFLFINLDPDAAALRDQAGGLEQEIRQYCPKLDEMVYVHRHSYDVKSNWKVLIDNFLECYHCHIAHKDFVDLVDMSTYRNIVNGKYISQISSSSRSASKAYKFEQTGAEFGYAGWYLWPNLTIWVYPGEANISVLQMIPMGPERTIEHLDWYLPAPEISPQVRDAMVYMDKTLQPEDIALCESVQRGVRSQGYNQGRFVIDPSHPELSEHGVHHFQRMVVEALGADLA